MRTGEEWFDRAVRIIEQATRPRRDGEHIRVLRGLRQLHDPALRPFFSTLLQSDNPFIQVHALLGEGAISESGRIDAWKLSQLDRVEMRRGALGEAIATDLIGPAELNEILSWPDLDDSTKSVVLVMLIEQGEEVDPGLLVELMDTTTSPMVGARCALVLLDLEVTEGCREALDSLNDLPRSIREEAVRNLLGLVQKQRLTGSEWWLEELVQREGLSSGTRLNVIGTMILLTPDQGRAAWTEYYESGRGIAHKLRASLTLLALAPHIQAADFQPIEQESNELLSTIGQVGAAVASGSSGADECMKLMAMHHPLSAAWIIDHAMRIAETDPDAASSIFGALIRDSMEEGGAMQERLELALVASRELIQLDPQAMKVLLDETERRQSRMTQEAILAGAWLSRSPNAFELVKNADQWLSTRAGSIAAIIKAGFAEVGTLSEDDLTRLGIILGGAGHVAPEYQVQAAWLYLRHTEQQGQALAMILSSISTDGAAQPGDGSNQ